MAPTYDPRFDRRYHFPEGREVYQRRVDQTYKFKKYGQQNRRSTQDALPKKTEPDQPEPDQPGPDQPGPRVSPSLHRASEILFAHADAIPQGEYLELMGHLQAVAREMAGT